MLYLVDPIDEWMIQSLSDFDGKKLVNAAKGDLDLGDLSKDEKKHQKEAQSEYKKFMKDFEEKMSDTLKEVRVTTRLAESPCCLVSGEEELGANLERILKMTNQKVKESKRTLELNPDHPIIKKLHDIYEAEPANPKLPDWYRVLVDQALLAEGSPIPEPASYVSKVNGFLAEMLGK